MRDEIAEACRVSRTLVREMRGEADDTPQTLDETVQLEHDEWEADKADRQATRNNNPPDSGMGKNIPLAGGEHQENPQQSQNGTATHAVPLGVPDSWREPGDDTEIIEQQRAASRANGREVVTTAVWRQRKVRRERWRIAPVGVSLNALINDSKP
jgi:hypothetical protein